MPSSLPRSAPMLALAAIAAFASGASAVGLEAAVARSKQTGLPMLVIGSSET